MKHNPHDIADDLYTRELQRVRGVSARSNGSEVEPRPLTDHERREFQRLIRANGDATPTLDELDRTALSAAHKRDNAGVTGLVLARPNPTDRHTASASQRSSSMAKFGRKKRDNRYTQSEVGKLHGAYATAGLPVAVSQEATWAPPEGLNAETMAALAGAFYGMKNRRDIQNPAALGLGFSAGGEMGPDGRTRGKRTQNYYLNQLRQGNHAAQVAVPQADGTVQVQSLPLYLSMRPQAGPVFPDGTADLIIAHGRDGSARARKRGVTNAVKLDSASVNLLKTLNARLSGTDSQKVRGAAPTQALLNDILKKVTLDEAATQNELRRLAAHVRDLKKQHVKAGPKGGGGFNIDDIAPGLLAIVPQQKWSAAQRAAMQPHIDARRVAKVKKTPEQIAAARAAGAQKAAATRAANKSAKSAKRAERKAAKAAAPATTAIATVSAEQRAMEQGTPAGVAATGKRNRKGAKRDNRLAKRDNRKRDNGLAISPVPGIVALLVGIGGGVPVSNLAIAKIGEMPTKIVGGALVAYGVASAFADNGKLGAMTIAPASKNVRSAISGLAIGLGIPMLFNSFVRGLVAKVSPSFANMGAAAALPAAGVGSIYDTAFEGTGEYIAAQGFGDDGSDFDIDDVGPELMGTGDYIAAEGLGAYIGEQAGTQGLGVDIDPEEMFAFEGMGLDIPGSATAGLGVVVEAGNGASGFGAEVRPATWLEGVSISSGVAGDDEDEDDDDLDGLGEDDDDEDDDLDGLGGLGEADMSDDDLDLEGLGALGAAKRRAKSLVRKHGKNAPRKAKSAAGMKIVRMTPATLEKISNSSKLRRVVAVRVLRKSTRVPNTFIVAIGRSKNEKLPAPGGILRKPSTEGIRPAPKGQEAFRPGGIFAETVFGGRGFNG